MNRDNSYLYGNKFSVGNKSNKTSFKKGHKPWNKGRLGWFPKGTENTRFKKGQPGLNWKPIGSITIRLDKNSKTKRRWIKIDEPNKWIEYAKYIWLKSGRKLIKGMVLHHINNNSFDDRIDNLIILNRSDHTKIHNRWNTKN